MRQFRFHAWIATMLFVSMTAFILFRLENGSEIRTTSDRPPVRSDDRTFRIGALPVYDAVARDEQLATAFASRFQKSETLSYFDTVVVEAPGSDEALSARLDNRTLHVAVVPAAVLAAQTIHLSSIDDWPYEIIARYPVYESVVVVRADSPIHQFEDLQGVRTAVLARTSSSGYRVPIAFLNSIGVTVEPVSGHDDHVNVVRAVLNGEVQAGFTHGDYVGSITAQERGMLRHLTIPSNVPGVAVVARRDVASDTTSLRLLQEAMLALASNEDKGYWSSLRPAVPEDRDLYERYRLTLRGTPPAEEQVQK